MKKILVLFMKDWDQLAIQAYQESGRYQFYFEGFDLFQFPQNARLLHFRVLNYISHLEQKYRNIGIDGVVSNHEQYGALIAAVLAERLGLPGNDPRAIIASQHKYYSRMIQERIVPEAVPRYVSIPFPLKKDQIIDLPYPFFVKPIKATYSVLAKTIQQRSELVDLLHFGYFEEWITRRLVKPFADIMPLYSDHTIDPSGMLAEEIMTGDQINIDGYCYQGQLYFLGTIDEVMYSGTDAFMRFEYPSQLPPSILERAKIITKKVLGAIHYQHGFFNIEFIYNKSNDQLKIIEINPRMASQLVNLYQRVDGYNPYDILFELAVGEEPKVEKEPSQYQAAASFVFRKFGETAVQSIPTSDQIQQALEPYPDANLMLYFKKGSQLKRELKWLGSYRYAVLNLGGINRSDLFERCQSISHTLQFDYPFELSGT
jgi:ATP-grasp domain